MADISATHEGLDMTLSRLFDAPRDLVFRAWTDDHMMSAWWGPHGFRATARMDARTGGRFELIMHAADGADYPITGEFLDIVLNERIVMEMRLDDHPQNWHDYLAELYTKAGGAEGTSVTQTVITRVTFADEAGGTRVTVTQSYPTSADRDAFAEAGNAGGWSQSFEKLAGLLLKG
ncbi:MAG: SRPBCC family protein [Asticcacaulis sp.]